MARYDELRAGPHRAFAFDVAALRQAAPINRFRGAGISLRPEALGHGPSIFATTMDHVVVPTAHIQ